MNDLPNPVNEDKYRRTGRSTRQALRIIAEAITNPCREYVVIDHFGTHQASKLLLWRIAELAEKMELIGFVFNQTKLTVRFNPPKYLP